MKEEQDIPAEEQDGCEDEWYGVEYYTGLLMAACYALDAVEPIDSQMGRGKLKEKVQRKAYQIIDRCIDELHADLFPSTPPTSSKTQGK